MSLLGPNRNRKSEQERKSQLERYRFPFASQSKADLRVKRISSPYRQHDGTLHPRIFRGYHNAPSEITIPAPTAPMFTTTLSSKNQFPGTYVMALVTVRKEVEDMPADYVTSVGAVFGPTSMYNYTRVVSETMPMPLFQLQAIIDAISAAYTAEGQLRAAGCQRLVIAIEREMEWIAHVLCRFQDLLDFTSEDEIRLVEYVRYPQQVKKVMEFLETFEALTKIKVQFWPTEKSEVAAAYIWANRAIDVYIANYDRNYYGVFDDSDFDEEDYYLDDDEEEDYESQSEEEAVVDVPLIMEDTKAKEETDVVGSSPVSTEPELLSDTSSDDGLASVVSSISLDDEKPEPATPPPELAIPALQDETLPSLPFQGLEKLLRFNPADIIIFSDFPEQGEFDPLNIKDGYGPNDYDGFLGQPTVIAMDSNQNEHAMFVPDLMH